MQIPNRPLTTRFVSVASLVFAYFVLYPQDLTALLSPVERTIVVSNVASPWLYALIGVAFISWTVIRVWGKSPSEVERPDVPPI